MTPGAEKPRSNPPTSRPTPAGTQSTTKTALTKPGPAGEDQRVGAGRAGKVARVEQPSPRDRSPTATAALRAGPREGPASLNAQAGGGGWGPTGKRGRPATHATRVAHAEPGHGGSSPRPWATPNRAAGQLAQGAAVPMKACRTERRGGSPPAGPGAWRRATGAEPPESRSGKPPDGVTAEAAAQQAREAIAGRPEAASCRTQGNTAGPGEGQATNRSGGARGGDRARQGSRPVRRWGHGRSAAGEASGGSPGWMPRHGVSGCAAPRFQVAPATTGGVSAGECPGGASTAALAAHGTQRASGSTGLEVVAAGIKAPPASNTSRRCPVNAGEVREERRGKRGALDTPQIKRPCRSVHRRPRPAPVSSRPRCGHRGAAAKAWAVTTVAAPPPGCGGPAPRRGRAPPGQPDRPVGDSAAQQAVDRARHRSGVDGAGKRVAHVRGEPPPPRRIAGRAGIEPARAGRCRDGA